MQIDNVGYDAQAMAAMTEKDFIELHLPNDAIARGLTQPERIKYLKSVYAALKKASKSVEK